MKVKQLGKQKLALGKGIASLLQTNTHNEVEMDIEGFKEAVIQQTRSPRDNKEGYEMQRTPYLVGLEGIKVNPYQPRKVFKEGPLRELANSIKENGLIQPLIVSQIEDNQFEIISGERRFRACQMLGLDRVPVLVKRVTDREKLAMAIIENVQRSDFNCIEEGLAYYRLMDEFHLTQEEVAKKMGKERSTIANFLRILKLPRGVVELLQKEKLSFGHGKVLVSIKDQEKCTRIAREVLKSNLSVRQTEGLIRKEQKEGEKGVRQKSFEEDLDFLREALEKKTGHHFVFKGKSNGAGQIIIHYNDKSELNRIFDYLMK